MDPKSYWLFTNSPIDNARRDELFQRYGLKRALELLSTNRIKRLRKCVSTFTFFVLSLAASAALAQSPAAPVPPAAAPAQGSKHAVAQRVKDPSPYAVATPPETPPSPRPFALPSISNTLPMSFRLFRPGFATLPSLCFHASERIIETVCGDKDWWQVDPVENILYVKPTKASISTNLTILGKSGTLYEFALEEITEVANAKPHVKVTVRWPESIKTEQAVHGPKFVTKAELDSVVQDYQQQLQVAAENVRTVQTAARDRAPGRGHEDADSVSR